MIFGFIDTNIYIKIVSQGNPGCERSHFEDLKTMVRGGAMSLLVPEIVLIELQHEIPGTLSRMEQDFDKFRERISKIEIWNELTSTKSIILDTIATRKADVCKQAQETAGDILAFLSSGDVDLISVTVRIFQSATNRLLQNRMPNKVSKAFDADCMIVESLIDYFMPDNNHHIPEMTDFYFCSHNVRDFFLELKPTTKDRSFQLHPLIQDGLPRCNVANTLREMLAFAQGYEKPPEVPPEYNGDYESYQPEGPDDPPDVDVDSKESWAQYAEWREANERRILQRFIEEQMPLLSDEVAMRRNSIATEIDMTLKECRKCKSWDETSEDKLASWMEYEPETLVWAASLPKLIRIRESLERYLRLHQEWDHDPNRGN